LLVGLGVNYIVIGEKVMATKKEKWDGRSRIVNDVYRKRFDEIFNKKEKTLHEELMEGFKKEQEELEDDE
tara:strand:- start:376 stop:585 length:210 start_codon:yes stop_codon:yes gene_type:complete